MNAGAAETAAIPSQADIHKQSQRERILAAALRCFVDSGFHSASMAAIADTAQISTGLIYRYFDNKNAIIFAIIESQLETARERICELRHTDDLGNAIIEYFEARDGDYGPAISPPLFLEISAEAARDPEIARVVSRIDSTVRAVLADWLRRSPGEGGYGLPSDVADERACALMLLIDGLKVRKAWGTNLDKRCLQDAIELIVGSVTRQ